MKRVVLIDAKNLCYRAHYAFRELRTSRKIPTSVLHGMPSLFIDVQKFVKAEHGNADYVICWDGRPFEEGGSASSKLWRAGVWPQYKQNREENEDRKLVRAQLPSIAKFFRVLRYLQIGSENLEADDLLSLTATALAARDTISDVFIYSNDTDLFQLVGGKIRILKPAGEGGIEQYDSAAVTAKLGVSPEAVARWKALAGDTTDNYKPIAGLGDKGAAKLIAAGINPSLDDFNKHSDTVANAHRAKLGDAWPLIHRCYQLADLPRVPTDLRILAFKEEAEEAVRLVRKKRVRRMNAEQLDEVESRFIKFCNRFELTSLMSRRRAFFESVLPPKKETR